MVPRVDVSLNQGGGHGVRPGHEDGLHSHHVELQSGRDEAVDVLADGDQHLPCHVAAFLGDGGLVLDVDPGRPALDEELAELDGGGGAAESGVPVGDDGLEVVDEGGSGPLLAGHAHSGLPLLAVVVLLSEEEVLDLVGNGVVRVVGEVRAGLVGGGVGGGALPPGHVDGVEVLGHHGDLDRVQ